MPLQNLNSLDAWFSSDGDFLIDGAGDIRDTKDSGNIYEGVRQQILHRIICEKSGWRFNSNITAGLEQFVGRIIDEELKEEMLLAIRSALTVDGRLNQSDFTLRIMEITPESLAILIYLNASNETKPIITMAYEIKSGSVVRVR